MVSADGEDGSSGPQPSDLIGGALVAELTAGTERDGLVSKITEFGCFVKLVNENRMGLVHVSTLAPDRLEKDEVPEFIIESTH